MDESNDFSALYYRHAKAAYGLALRLTADHMLAEDAVQESMLRVWRSLASFRPDNIRSWLLRIVVRECIRMRRRRKIERDRAARLIPREDPGPETEHADGRALLLLALANLNAGDHNLILLYYGKGLSQREISSALAMPQQTVSFRIRKALHCLRNCSAAQTPAGLSSE